MFETHILNSVGELEVKQFKTAMALTMKVVLGSMTESYEKSIFQLKIQEAVFFGTKAIASKPGNFDSVKSF